METAWLAKVLGGLAADGRREDESGGLPGSFADGVDVVAGASTGWLEATIESPFRRGCSPAPALLAAEGAADGAFSLVPQAMKAFSSEIRENWNWLRRRLMVLGGAALLGPKPKPISGPGLFVAVGCETEAGGAFSGSEVVVALNPSPRLRPSPSEALDVGFSAAGLGAGAGSAEGAESKFSSQNTSTDIFCFCAANSCAFAMLKRVTSPVASCKSSSECDFPFTRPKVANPLASWVVANKS